MYLQLHCTVLCVLYPNYITLYPASTMYLFSSFLYNAASLRVQCAVYRTLYKYVQCSVSFQRMKSNFDNVCINTLLSFYIILLSKDLMISKIL